jgi:hypothetical protein
LCVTPRCKLGARSTTGSSLDVMAGQAPRAIFPVLSVSEGHERGAIPAAWAGPPAAGIRPESQAAALYFRAAEPAFRLTGKVCMAAATANETARTRRMDPREQLLARRIKIHLAADPFHRNPRYAPRATSLAVRILGGTGPPTDWPTAGAVRPPSAGCEDSAERHGDPNQRVFRCQACAVARREGRRRVGRGRRVTHGESDGGCCGFARGAGEIPGSSRREARQPEGQAARGQEGAPAGREENARRVLVGRREDV